MAALSFVFSGLIASTNISTTRRADGREHHQPFSMNCAASCFNSCRDMDTEILQWARDRQSIFFSQMQPYGLLASSNAPVFSQFGGRAPVGFALVMTNLVGTIYYTTNGSDPRVAFTSAVSPSAIRLRRRGDARQHRRRPRARSLQAGVWSAMTEATFTVGSLLGIPARITEIMYNPPGGSLQEFIRTAKYFQRGG